MYNRENDNIVKTVVPTDWERVGERKFSDMNILFYYEIRSSNL